MGAPSDVIDAKNAIIASAARLLAVRFARRSMARDVVVEGDLDGGACGIANRQHDVRAGGGAARGVPAGGDERRRARPSFARADGDVRAVGAVEPISEDGLHVVDDFALV